MSASSGNVRNEAATKTDEKNRGSPDRDVEQGDPEAEQKRNNDIPDDEDEEDVNLEEGDEYTRLLKYIDVEAKKQKHKGDDGDDEEEVETKRLWYAPWKKVEVEREGQRKVPSAWLETEMTKGLTDEEITNRRNKFGFNELESPRENPILKFATYFRGPILYVMELAVLLAAGLRDWIDFGVIIGILALNAFVGWYQEKQAGDIVEQLKAGIAMKAIVVRNGQEQEIEAREIVPGDIVIVEEGSTIPADGHILANYDDKDRSKAKEILQKREQSGEKVDPQGSNDAASSRSDEKHGEPGADGEEDNKDDEDEKKVDKGPSVLSCDQSAITGESLAVDKYVGDTIYYTTGAKRGKVYMVVSAIAKESFVGNTARLVNLGSGEGHFQKVMTSIGTSLLVLVIVWLFAVWIGGFFRGVSIATPSDNNLLVYTLIFLIIGVPVGLPCVTTTTMAVGAAFLARKKAIVQKLTAIESLAGVDVLCTDKTGTLTANQLSVHEPWAVEGVDLNWMLTVAVLASSHNIKALDPIDKVTVTTLKDYPKAREMLKGGWTTHKFTPFDPVSKRITAEVERDGKKYTCAKGAPNAILRLAKAPKEVQELYKEKTQEYAKRGFRTLGVACQENGGEWKVLGLLPMFDPPRSDTAQMVKTIAEAGELGVKVKMLTGDAVAIAIETCKQLALGTNVYDSERLITGGMAGSEIHDFVESADGFAEVAPEHKYQVVEMLQNRGHLTAMTGDGVNDAPSLKRADCGIAVEGASDAARSAADVVFLDEGLSTIITSIKVARQIFHRMKAYIVYRIALCLHLEIYLTISMIVLNETIRADLIVFIALFADLGTIAIAYDNAPYAKAPVEWQLPKIWIMSTILGGLLAAGTWILRGTLFLSPDGNHGGIIQNWGSVQEILFLEVSLTENWLIFVTRGAGTWPSWQLVGAILGIDILASLFAIFGWISGDQPHNGHTDIVTIVRVWAYSFGVTVICALVYFILDKIPWLDRIGKHQRGTRNKSKEDFLTNLRRLTLVHQHIGGEDFFRFQPEDETTANAANGGAAGGQDQKKPGEKKGEKKEGEKKEGEKKEGETEKGKETKQEGEKPQEGDNKQ